MQSLSPSSCSAGGFESAICHVPVLSVIVLGAAGALSSPAEGQSVLKLIWPEVLWNYPFVVLKLLASWHDSHAFWLRNLITWKNGRGKKGQENLQAVMTEGGKSLFLQKPYQYKWQNVASIMAQRHLDASHLLLLWNAVLEQIKMLMVLCHIPSSVRSRSDFVSSF